MPTGGIDVQMTGEIATIGSCRYCFRSSSAIGSVEKYEKVLLSGINSSRKRATRSSTESFGVSVELDIPRFDCNRAVSWKRMPAMSENSIDAIIELYKRDVDVTMIDEGLKL